MPEICRFFGIIIRMFFEDHGTPHFHAEYNEHSAKIQIDPLAVIAGDLPPRTLGLVLEWTQIHQEELLKAYTEMQKTGKIIKIKPLE